ncbi:MAG: FKBP-type peptidyl-prolyl cis-trans isomerase [Spirochaetaceae bacterium]|nr:FKBP-type peptidyl-prolyl cis-trans isomerase [Spirochaetaceae bacterium]
MKKLLAALAVAALLSSCQAAKPAAAPEAAGAPAAAAAPKTADASYAFGVLMGNSLKSTSVAIDGKAFLKGMTDAMGKGKPKISLEQANETVQTALMAAAEKKAKENMAAEEKFLAENGKKAGVVTTPSGLQYEVLAQGTGAKPKATDTVKVDYVGTLLDGSTFDSSIERGEPAIIPLEQVIPGWSEGLQLMNVGGKYKLVIPSALAYGAEGAGAAITPYSTVVFEVTLLSIEAPAKN